MKTAIISRLKKSKQPIKVVDRTGAIWHGIVSHWDDHMFSIRLDNGDDMCFPMDHFASITVPGGLEMREDE
jgi:hypothetical protein